MRATLDRGHSKRLCEMIRAENGDCYKNALMAAMCLNTGERERAEYVEGWAWVAGGMILHNHGWLELDQRVLDPTPAWWDEDFHENPNREDNRYYGVRRYNAWEVIERTMAEDDVTLPLDRDFQNECIPKDCLEIYVQANADCYGPEIALSLEHSFGLESHDQQSCPLCRFKETEVQA
ncbi:MAG: hypothetical protein GY809_31955 [Planctomycetes bacterium]|nr:hypothetical protein [Planctomycetota bacterium]